MYLAGFEEELCLKPDLKRAHIDPASTRWVGSEELLQVFEVKSRG